MTTFDPSLTTTAPTRGGDPLGAPLNRLDGHAKTHGIAAYAADHHPDDLAYAALVHAEVARGVIQEIDTATAEQVHGVLRVLTHRNAPRTRTTPKPGLMSPAQQASSSSVDILRTEEISYDGQPVAVVVAESIDAAQEAAALVRVRISATSPAADFAAELPNATRLSAPFVLAVRGRKGDAERALAAAPVSVEAEYTTPEYTHNAIEPHATTAWWEGDRLTVQEATQAIDGVARHLAARFGIPAANVRVISHYVGGAFGGKSHVWPSTFLAALAAKAVNRPVQLALTRAGVYRTVGGRTASWQRVGIGADPDGHFTAIVHHATTRLGRTGGHPEQVTSGTHDQYAADTLLHDQKAVSLDLVPNTFMRAPGESIGTFALESTIDELANRLAIDPVELRLRNQPHAAPVTGNRFTHHRAPELLRVGADLFGWSRRSPRPGSMRDGNHLVGWGMAAAYHSALLFDANLALAVTAEGRAVVRCGFQEMGMGVATVTAQMTAHVLGIDADLVSVEYGDSSLPTAPAAGGSIQTATIAGALERARPLLYRALTDAARRRAAELGLNRGTVSIQGAVVTDGRTRVGLGELARTAPGGEITVQVGADSGLRGLLGQGRMFGRMFREQRSISRAATGAQFCEVRIDADTGELRVSRWLGVFDIGRVVNAKTADSQLRGGIVMGLGLALSEATLIDPRTGRIVNPSLTEYLVPVHADVPPIELHVLDDPDPSMPLGVVGAGEVGITGVAAAIANAVHHATGRRIRDLPITLDRLVGDWPPVS